MTSNTRKTPYYDEDGVTLYLGDCREVFPQIEADVTITDPPYNVGKDYGQHDDRMEASDYEGWLRSVFEACPTPEVVFFPGTKNVLRAREVLPEDLRPHRMLGWHKKEFAGDKWTGGPAMCWEPVIWASRRARPEFNRIFGTMGRDFFVVSATHGDPYTRLHPCPKPLPVMVWLVGLFVPEGGTVLDPFAGTGTTLKAARDQGRRAIGIEAEERYCEAAVQRLAQGVLTA